MNFIKEDVAYNEFSNKIENYWTWTSEATWRSELIAFLFADVWLNANTFNVRIQYNLQSGLINLNTGLRFIASLNLYIFL